MVFGRKWAWFTKIFTAARKLAQLHEILDPPLCKMMSYLVYSVKYLACILVTTKASQAGDINLGFINHPCPQALLWSQAVTDNKSLATIHY